VILIALGSNLSGPWGSPRDTVLRALAEMQRHNIRVLTVSRLIETAPFGVVNQPNFVNAVARIETALPPDILMRALHMIERRAGRRRLKRWGPRTLDLDLLDYHGLVRKPSRYSIKPLALPHPGIEQRSFVLQPILDVAPGWKHPVTSKAAALTLRQLTRLNRD
jgi:2-amino-4-hydroxy-6-hydroxymethyldihydropteridine diphosphokinase